MIKNYLAYFLLIILSACSSKSTNSVKLNGEIRGLGNDTIYIHGTDKFYDRIDTLVVKDDKFSATLSIDTLVYTKLQFSNGIEYPLYLNKGDKILIKGSAAELSILDITGNLPNEELTAFQNEMKGLGKPSEKVIKEKAEKFIDNHPASLVNIYLLERYFIQQPHPDLTLIKRMTDRMTGELKDRPYLDELLDKIEKDVAASVGNMAPYFHLSNKKGEYINRTDFNGKYLLIHFWASWDQQSRDSNKVLRRIYRKEQKNKDFTLLSISLDIDKECWKEAIRKDTLNWEQCCDFSGWNTEIVKQFAIQSLPANVLLGPTGIIEGRNLNSETIEKKLEEIKSGKKVSNAR